MTVNRYAVEGKAVLVTGQAYQDPKDALNEFVSNAATNGLTQVAIETGKPIGFGVLTCDSLQQAMARVDKGAEAVRTALEMADVFSQLRATAQSH